MSVGLPRSGAKRRAAARPKRLATQGRNVEGETYVICDVGGERQLRCKGCGTVVPVAKWWGHSCPDAAIGKM